MILIRIKAVASVQQPFSCMNVAYALSYATVRGGKKSSVETYYAPNARILAVDDNMINLQVIVGLLQPHKIKVDTADGGRECLRMVKKHQYDLILMDHLMPDVDGIQALHTIRAEEGNPNQSTPIIALTANALEGMEQMYLSEGFDGYLSKPIATEQLEALLKQYLLKAKQE